MGEAATVVSWIWKYLGKQREHDRIEFLIYQMAMIECLNQGFRQFDNVSTSQISQAFLDNNSNP